MVVARDRQRFALFCACEGQRDGAGHCGHLKRYWPLIKPWYRSRMTIVTADWRAAMDLEPDLTNRPLVEHPRNQAERWV